MAIAQFEIEPIAERVRAGPAGVERVQIIAQGAQNYVQAGQCAQGVDEMPPHPVAQINGDTFSTSVTRDEGGLYGRPRITGF